MPVAVITTQHEKAPLIQPALQPLDVVLWEYTQFDTDTLGTFSGEVERTLSPADCARLKAQKACELTGIRYGIGSEGSFGGGPYPGLINWNQEVLCWLDSHTQQTVYARAEGPFEVSSLEPSSRQQIEAHIAPFHSQKWMLKHADGVAKGLNGDELLALFARYQGQSGLEVLPDLRAMNCPSRQEMIQRAAGDLASRLQSLCPVCQSPDYVVKSAERGLPCDWCGTPTEQIARTQRRCDQCGHTEWQPVESNKANPAHCMLCNP